MALVKLQPASGALNNQTTLPEVLGKDNESTFTSLYPESKVGSLLKYVEGYPWTVHYYGQIVNTANTLAHLDPSTPSFNQPYYEVVGAVLQVSSPLTTAYDENNAVTSVNGSALVPFRMTPNVGDLFLAQVDTGEDAFFIVNSVYRKTHRKDTLYEVNYALYQYASSNPGLLTQIKSKVQQTYHHSSDNQFNPMQALITPAEHQAVLDLKSLVAQTQHAYFERFYKREAGTILLPGVPSRVYDPYLIGFLTKTVSHEVMGSALSQFSVFERYAQQPVFWNMLLTRDASMASRINRTVGFASTQQLRNMARLGSVYHAGLDHVVLCKSPDLAADVERLSLSHPDLWTDGMVNLSNGFVHLALVKTLNNAQSADKALLHPLFEQDHYVVSPAFFNYLGDTNAYSSISYVEWVLARFIKRQAISKSDVVSALQSAPNWSVLHQLYLLPALWLVAKNLH